MAYQMPVTGTSPMDGILRQMQDRKRKQAEIEALRKSSAGWEKQAIQPQDATTGGGNSRAQIGDNTFDIPAPQYINWGGILEKGVSSFQASKEKHEANTKQGELDTLDSQFFEATMRDDPQAQKLVALAQITGDYAPLAQHLAPKKNGIGALTQYMASPGADSAMIPVLAKQYGLSDEDTRIAMSAAETQRKYALDSEQRKFTQQKELAQMRKSDGGGYKDPYMVKYGMPMEEFMSLPQDEQDHRRQSVSTYKPPKDLTPPMAVLTQYLNSPGANEEMAGVIGRKMGMTEEDITTAKQAAKDAKQAGLDKETRKNDHEFFMQDMKGAQADDRAHADPLQKKLGITVDEALKMDPAELQRRKDAVSMNIPRESQESKERAKLKVEAESELPMLDERISRMQDIAQFAKKATYLPMGQGLAPAAAGNPNNVMLKQSINQLVLDVTHGKLGAGVSNADVTFLKAAQVELEAGNVDTAVAMVNKALTGAVQQRATYQQRTGQPVTMPGLRPNAPRSPLDYTKSKEMLDKNGGGFDAIWKEVGVP